MKEGEMENFETKNKKHEKKHVFYECIKHFLPAYAASICNQTFSWLQTGPISLMSSKAQVPVVPNVATTWETNLVEYAKTIIV